MPTNDPRPTKAVRRDEARAKAAQMRKEQERKAKRNRILAISGLVVAVLALAGVAYSIVQTNKANEAANSNVAYGQGSENVVAPTLDDVTAPAPANDSGGIPVSGSGGDDVGVAGEGDVDLTIYFDYMCPYCGQFDATNAGDLDAMLEEGGVTITYHPVAILDHMSAGSSYSTRAVNATAIVADKSPEHFTDFVTAMYKEQPDEGTVGSLRRRDRLDRQGRGRPRQGDGHLHGHGGRHVRHPGREGRRGHLADVRPVGARRDRAGLRRRAGVLDAHRAHQRRALQGVDGARRAEGRRSTQRSPDPEVTGRPSTGRPVILCAPASLAQSARAPVL